VPVPPETAVTATEPAASRGPRGEQRRAALLRALEELLRTRPLAEFGIRDITEAAGVTRSGFYFYFPTKEAAVAELLRELFDEIMGGAAAFLEGDAWGDEAIELAITNLVASWRGHRRLMVALLDARDADPATRVLWDEWVDAFAAPIARAITDERAAGRAADGPDPLRIAHVLLGANERTLERMVRTGDDDARDDEVVATLTWLWTTTIYGGS
jgi:AcrR family transcriptional regulator